MITLTCCSWVWRHLDPAVSDFAADRACCVTITLVGSWFFSNQPLPWNIFGTVLPGAFSVQAVRVPQLNAPAYFTMQNVSIVYDTCGTDFASAAQLLVSKAAADTEDLSTNNLAFNGNDTLYCQTCIFQGSEQVPSAYSGAVSVVSLYNTQIRCLWTGSGNASAGTDTAPGQSLSAAHPPSLHSSAASWAPPIGYRSFWLLCVVLLLHLVCFWFGVICAIAARQRPSQTCAKMLTSEHSMRTLKHCQLLNELTQLLC